MKNSSARKGTLAFSEEDRQKIAALKEAAEREICQDGKPLAVHRAAICGYDVAFIQNVDLEDGSAQYQLQIMAEEGQPPLDVVQAMAVPFFGDKTYQIMPDERNPFRIKVTGLFFGYPAE
jgi:hypothetical protein